MSTLFRLPKVVPLDSGGVPYAGAKLEFFLTGTATNTDTYTDSALATPHANPVVADANGVFAPIYLDPDITYKATLTQSDDTLIYTVDPVSEHLTQANLGLVFYPQTSAESTAGVTPVNYFNEPGDIRRYGDITTAGGFQSAWDDMIASGHRGFIPEGSWSHNDTLTVSESCDIYTGSKKNTTLTFVNAVADKVQLDLTNLSSRSRVNGIRFIDNTPGTSRAIKIKDELSGAGGTGPNWKNAFEFCEWRDFKVWLWLTSADPTDGSDHAWCSEPLFLHCKVQNCRTAIIGENQQAVDITLLQTDIENDDSGESYTFIQDKAGIDIVFYKCSLIGKGKLLTMEYETGSTGIFAQAHYTFDDCRIELRSTHNGVVIEQVSSTQNVSQEAQIDFKGGQINCFTQTLDLLQYAGRIHLTMDSVQVINGTLEIEQYPTDGFTSILSSTIGGSLGQIDIINTPRVVLNRNTTSAYDGGAAYSANRTGRVSINGRATAGGTYDIPTDNFFSLRGHTYCEHLAHGLNVARPQQMIYDVPVLTTGMADVKFKLPKFARPLKALLFKDFTRIAEATTYEVYIVKDNADWVTPGTFDHTTDAVIAATITTVNPEAGFYEAALKPGTAIGTNLQAGFGSWTEGRIYFRKTAGANNHAGYLGIEFL